MHVCVCVPEVLQSLVLAQFSMQFPDLQSHQTQQDVESVSLFPRLSEQHHVILERPSQQSYQHNNRDRVSTGTVVPVSSTAVS